MHGILTYTTPYQDKTQLVSVGDIGLVEIPKEDRPKYGQRNLLVQVMSMESDQLVLAPVLETGVGPNLSIRFSRKDFVKGDWLIFLKF